MTQRDRKFMVKTPTRELFYSTASEVVAACNELRPTCIISIFVNPGRRLIWQGPACERPTIDRILDQVKAKISAKEEGIIRDFGSFGLEHESKIRERFIKLSMSGKVAPSRLVSGSGVMVIDDGDGWVFFTDMAGNYLRFNDALGRLAAGLSRHCTHDASAVEMSNLIHGILCYPPNSRL